MPLDRLTAAKAVVRPFRPMLAAGLALAVTLAGALVGALVLPATAAARSAEAALLQAPWPQAPAAGGLDGREVRLDSADPFALTDVASAPGREVVARLYLPEDASAAEPVPAVVLLHGAGGVLAARELTYARQFAEMGVAALVLDAFGNRRDLATGFIERLLSITEAMLLADAFAGLRFLDGLPEVDGGRVALVGFSYGAMAATFAAYEQVAETYAPGGERFAGHAAYYGPCIARFRDNRATGAPLLMLIGSEDEITDPERCAAVAEELRDGGAEVELIRYEGAYHQWDGGRAGPRRSGRNLADCNLTVTRAGTVRDSFTRLSMGTPLLRRAILGLCAGSEGYLIGRDDSIRERSNADLGRFLGGVFADP